MGCQQLLSGQGADLIQQGLVKAGLAGVHIQAVRLTLQVATVQLFVWGANSCCQGKGLTSYSRGWSKLACRGPYPGCQAHTTSCNCAASRVGCQQLLSGQGADLIQQGLVKAGLAGVHIQAVRLTLQVATVQLLVWGANSCCQGKGLTSYSRGWSKLALQGSISRLSGSHYKLQLCSFSCGVPTAAVRARG